MSMWQKKKKKKSHYKEVTQRVLPCKQELKESTHLVPGKDQMNPFLFSSQALRAASPAQDRGMGRWVNSVTWLHRQSLIFLNYPCLQVL